MGNDAWLDQPLTDSEIERLDDFLLSDVAPEHSMNVSSMDGFITAVASGPNMIMPCAMLSGILDAEHRKATPEFTNSSEARQITGMILRHWNDVNATLNQAPDAYEPLFFEREVEGDSVPIIDDWCEGYWKGIEVDREAWTSLLTLHPEWFRAIKLYGTEEGWAELSRQQYRLEQHQAFALSLADSARNIHRYWTEQRQQQIARGELPGVIGGSQPLRRAVKIGRNDPCPCGSGKKYKRCHGRAGDAQPDAAPIAQNAGQDAPPIVHSPLSQRVTRDGMSVDIEIFEDGEGGWLLEVIDEFGTSTVWDAPFPTDQAALVEALETIETEGIASVMGVAPANATKH